MHFVPTTEPGALALLARIRQSRRDSLATRAEAQAVGRLPSCRSLASAHVTSLGLQPVDWQALDRYQAEDILQRVLSHDLAYTSSRHLDDATAAELAEGFLSLFSPDACFFSNGDGADYQSSARGGLTPATFDKGVVVVDGPLVGLLWVTGED